MIDLRFSQVSKRYRLRQAPGPGAAARQFWRRLPGLRRPEDFWALREVSFEVKRGEALGIIGHNGAGKSTILKLLSKITAPTSGEILINGHLSALIEIGSGFHPELTGRENVFLNGSILGMSRREIAAKLGSILEFAGVEKFAETPVKRYSSGMYVRLGFSIAAHLNPDILLLDEVLAVGDTEFQAKCLQRVRELKAGGTTLVFISHDLGAVEHLCDRALLMQRGGIAADGPPDEVIAEYQRLVAALDSSAADAEAARLSREVEITGVSLHDAGGGEAAAFETGVALRGRVGYVAHEPVTDVVFGAYFYSPDGELQCHLTSEWSCRGVDLEPGAGAAEFFCDELGLRPGLYFLDVVVRQREGLDLIAQRPRSAMLRVDPGRLVRGNFYMPHGWRVTAGDGPRPRAAAGA